MSHAKMAGSTKVAMAGGLLLFLLAGCSASGELSPIAYDCAKALFSICNRRDVAALDKVRVQIEDSQAAGSISSTEAGQLRSIVAAAEGGNWEAGLNRSRRLLEGQQSRTPKSSMENQVSEPRGGPRRK